MGTGGASPSPAVVLAILGSWVAVVVVAGRIGDSCVVYGLGNLLANCPRALRRDELLVQVRLTERDVRSPSAELGRTAPVQCSYWIPARPAMFGRIRSSMSRRWPASVV